MPPGGSAPPMSMASLGTRLTTPSTGRFGDPSRRALNAWAATPAGIVENNGADAIFANVRAYAKAELGYSNADAASLELNAYMIKKFDVPERTVVSKLLRKACANITSNKTFFN